MIGYLKRGGAERTRQSRSECSNTRVDCFSGSHKESWLELHRRHRIIVRKPKIYNGRSTMERCQYSGICLPPESSGHGFPPSSEKDLANSRASGGAGVTNNP